MREVVLDTETTGLDPRSGHRIIEIGCVELLNCVPTGRCHHVFVNPDRLVPAEAQAIHGITDAFLADKPPFAAIADDFLSFIGLSPLVIHNAAFDLGFINHELERLARPLLTADRAVDTVQLARRKYPGAPASLDALCRRFQIDLSDRTLHGALKDCQLLAQVYLELQGGRQPGLHLTTAATITRLTEGTIARRPLRIAPTAAEELAHAATRARLTDPIWSMYLDTVASTAETSVDALA
jgi:DNA polymerase III subunit epsilon